MTRLAAERGPAVPEKMPCVGYYDADADAAAVVHKLTLVDSGAGLTPVISAGVTAVRIAPDADVCVAIGPAPAATDADSPHWERSSEIVKVEGGAHRVSAVLLSGSGAGTVWITELH